MRLQGRIDSAQRVFYGSTLAAAALTNDTEITMRSPEDFDVPDEGEELTALLVDADDGEITEQVTYSDFNEDTGLMTLAAPLAADWAAGTIVEVTPQPEDWEAEVRVSDYPDDTITATIPTYIVPFVRTEIQGDDGQAVEIEQTADGDWEVVNLPGEEAVFDGAHIPPATLPSQPTDGNPPGASPLPSVQGHIRSLRISWAAAANPDVQTIEAHLATTDANPPGAGTKVGEVVGNEGRLYPDALADGAPLSAGTNYYAATIARDADGAAAPSAWVGPVQLQLVTSPDIVAESIIAESIATRAVQAEHIDAVHILATEYWTALTGQRMGFTPDGLKAFDAADDPTVSIPPVGNVWLKAMIEAQGGDFTGPVTLRDLANVLAAGAALEMKSAIADPPTGPTVAYAYDEMDLDAAATDTPSYRWGLWHDSNGFGSQATYLFVTQGTLKIRECRASDGVFLREKTLTAPPGSPSSDWYPMGVFRRGSYIYSVLYAIKYGSPSEIHVRRYNQSDFVVQSTVLVSNRPSGSGSTFGPGGLVTVGGVDYYAILWQDTTDNDRWKVELHGFDGSGNVSATIAATLNLGAAGEFRSFEDPVVIVEHDGKWWVLEDSNEVRVFTRPATLTDPARSADDDFSTATYYSLTHDGSRFVGASSSYPRVFFHEGWTWPAAQTPYYEVAYTWFHDGGDGRGGAADKETKSSPSTLFAHRKRAKMRITVPARPSGTTHAGLYVVLGAGNTPEHQADSAATTTDLTGVAAGATPPGSNSFSGGTPALVKDGQGNTFLDADRRVRVRSGTARPATPFGAGELDYDTALLKGLLYDGSAWKQLLDQEDRRLTIIKELDQSKTTQITPQDDDELFFAVAANEERVWEAVLVVATPTAADFRCTFIAPSGAEGYWWVLSGASTEASSARADQAKHGAHDFGQETRFITGHGLSTPFTLVRVGGIIRNGATSGNVRLRWAQETASGTTTVKKFSHLIHRAP